MTVNRRDALALLGSSAALAGFSALNVPAFAQASRDDTIRVAWPYELATLDPTGVGAQRSTWCASIHLYDRLVSYEVNERDDGTRQYDPNTVAPELAESWERSGDNKTITFKLQSGATFHDGSPVTAEDVRWSIERALNVPSAAGVMRVGGITSADQLSAPDDGTFVVQLTDPNRYSISVFSIPFAIIINKKVALEHATDDDPWANEWLKFNAAGSGAYKLDDMSSQQLSISRNPDWASGPAPAIEKVIFQTIPEATIRTTVVERGSADIAIEIPPNDFAAVAQRGQAQAVAIPMPNHMDFMAFNSQAEPFNDIRVRQAVAHSLPYDDIFNTVFQGRGIPLHGGNGSARPGEFPQPHSFMRDIEKAKALLAEAGHADGFTTSIAYAQGKAAIFDPLALAIRGALLDVGITVDIQPLPGSSFSEGIASRTLPLMLDNRIAWLSQPDYWFRAFYTGDSTSNMGNYQSDKLKSMLDALPGDASDEVYAEKTGEMANLVLTEIPMLPMRQGAFELVMAKGIAGYTYWFHGLPDARSLSRA
ncbi:MAG: ABC transporter substrate-binding protein [Phyllobacteriaceae bacterium]|nr:ABC transporter substrate-binding protein [Phyllobacteriaceae bacterium]MBA92334.1 ABC transporter substrate-binding protein [Phyllobacteriaceae bacterium]